MKYAIIAAGDNSCLGTEGMTISQPLLLINGETVIDRMIRIFQANEAESISVIVNENRPEVYNHLKQLHTAVPLHIFAKNTPSSIDSFYELKSILSGGKFCLVIANIVFKEEDFSRYIHEFINSDCDGMIATTKSYFNDKPLFVQADQEMNITGFTDDVSKREKHISGGIYCFGDKALDVLQKSISNGLTRLRNYQQLLISEHLNLKAYPFTRIINISHIEDINRALRLVS